MVNTPATRTRERYSVNAALHLPTSCDIQFHRDITSNLIVFEWVILRVSLFTSLLKSFARRAGSRCHPVSLSQCSGIKPEPMGSKVVCCFKPC
jgi:hypothetical protein